MLEVGCLTFKKSLECAGSARDRAKVVDQVRFLARTLARTAPLVGRISRGKRGVE